MRILIVGAGAVGGYFGARLTDAGRDVTFLVRDARAEQLRRTGLLMMSPFGDLQVTPKLIGASELLGRHEAFELILLSTKAYSLNAAMDDFAAAVGPATSILPLLNGMCHLDSLAGRFGEGAVLGGSTRIVADVDGEGRIHVAERLHDLVFGERDRRVTPRVERIAEIMRNAGFDDQLSPDVLAFMWQKWTMLASMASITCLLGGTVGEVAAAPGGAETAHAIITEVAAIAAANGYPNTPTFLAGIHSRLTTPGSVLTASMYRDMRRGAPVEAEHILGDLLARGQARAVAAPLLTAAYAQLSVYGATRGS